MPNPLHITMQLAIAWLAVNATLVALVAALFTLHTSRDAFLRRRHRRLRKPAIVIPFSRD